MSKVAEKLRAARALIERGWTQDAYARNAAGEDLEDVDWEFSDTEPVCWCLAGALAHVGLGNEADEIMQQATGARFFPEWNDTPGRTQAEVIEAFDRAIALAAATGTAKTAKRVECEASQSGPKGVAQ